MMPRGTCLLLVVLCVSTCPAQIPVLKQSTLGDGVLSIDGSRLDLGVRFVYEIDAADLDGDQDQDLVESHFYLFNPPLSVPNQTVYYPVKGSGGLRILDNVSGDIITSPSHPGQPQPYQALTTSFRDLPDISWVGDVAPSVRDVEIVDLDQDGSLDIVLSAGVGVDPAAVNVHWKTSPQAWEHPAQNRILMRDTNGQWQDVTFGADGVPGGTGVNRDRLPVRVSNSCGVTVGDVNGDGWVDIIFGEYGPNFVGDHNVVLLNDPLAKGYFVPVSPNPFSTAKPIPGATADVELGDIDADGDLDLVVANANPMRAAVVALPGKPAPLPGAVETRRNEVWLNDGSGNFTLLPLSTLVGGVPTPGVPDPAGLPTAGAPIPYDDPGFWNDTRACALFDVEGDGDLDILFANNGWRGARPDMALQALGDLPGQAPQLLLNLGGAQAEFFEAVIGGAMTTLTFLDVADHALPWGEAAYHQVIPGSLAGWRAWKDFEVGPLGRPSDAIGVPQAGAFPQDDGFPDIVAALGPASRNEVFINSGDATGGSGWDVFLSSSGRLLTKGRFLVGRLELLPGWTTWINNAVFQDLGLPTLYAAGFFYGTNQAARRFGFDHDHDFYTHDIDLVDLDDDGHLDIITADGDPERGEISAIYFSRGLKTGYRWLGPSDEGAVLPFRKTVLAYGGIARDLDADGDMDIIVPGVPTALVLLNDGTGKFHEATFNDTNSAGILPFTGVAPLYGPILTESVEAFDADGDLVPELFFVGYPPYQNAGDPFGAHNEAVHWHLPDPLYHHFWSSTPPGPTEVYASFYLGGATALNPVRADRTLRADPNTNIPWLDRRNRVIETIGDRVRAADLDNDGDLDLVTGYRPPQPETHPLPIPTSSASNPTYTQVGVSLWMNDGAGHLRDEALERVAIEFFEAAAADVFESIAFLDIDADGDLDIFLASLRSALNSSISGTGTNRLLINMGGLQQNENGGPWRTGMFALAGPGGGNPLGDWPGYQGHQLDGPHDSGSVVAADLDGDDRMDLVLTGQPPVPTPPAVPLPLPNVNALVLHNRTMTRYSSTDPTPGRLERVLFQQILDNFYNVPENGLDNHMAVAVGDFDDDGDPDVVLLPRESKFPRYLQNDTAPSTGNPVTPTFTDRSAKTSPAGYGEAAPDAISWVTMWSANEAMVADFDGNGVQDVYAPNFEHTAQDELFLSTVSPSGPRVTGVEPLAGTITGGTFRLFGKGLGAGSTVAIHHRTLATPVSVTVTFAASNELRCTMPAGAPLGPCRVRVTSGSATSRDFTITHLNAAPVIGDDLLPAAVDAEFHVTDADGASDILENPLVTVWVQTTPASPKVVDTANWTITTTTTDLQIKSLGNPLLQAGAIVTVEVGDASAAYTVKESVQ